MKDIILVDIDHTISDAFHRDQMIGIAPWDEYHSASEHDDPAHDFVKIMESFRTHGFKIVGLTSRPEKWRKLTNDWLFKHGIYLDMLIMRPNDNYTRTGELKVSLCREIFGSDWKEKVLCMIDDNENVIAAFRAENVTCLQIFNKTR
jgi:hypothetical protein